MKKNFLKGVFFGALMLFAATSFVACSDYDDDIDDLKGQIETLKTDLAALKTAVGTFVKSVSYNETTGELTVESTSGTSKMTIGKSTVKYTLSVADGKVILTGDDGSKTEATLPAGSTGESFDPSKLTVNEAGEVVYGDAKTGVTIPNSTTNASITEIKDGETVIGYTIKINDQAATFYINDALPLKSIVFEPQSYLKGVEAMKAVTLNYNQWTVTTGDNPTTDRGEIWKTNGTARYITPNVVAYYHVNPASATTDQIKSLKYLFDDKEYVTPRAAKFNPEIVKYEIIDGMLRVEIKPVGEFIQPIDEGEISVMALQVTTATGEEIVTSDYAAIYKTNIKDLVLAHNKIGTPHHKHLYGADNADNLIGRAENAIWQDYATAVRQPAQYTVVYKDDELDISKLIETHYTEWTDEDDTQIIGTNDKVMANIADYGLEYKYSLSNYHMGTNKTKQNDFAELNGSILKAKLFDESAEGGFFAAVGRTPVVRVELVDKATGYVANAGWIKVQIVKGDVAPQEWNKDFGTIKLQCADHEMMTTVQEMNVNIYNKVGLSKEEFHQLYKLKLKTGSTTEADPKNPLTDQGIVTEVVNTDDNDETTLLLWTLDPQEVFLDADGKFEFTATYAGIDASRGDFDITFTATLLRPAASYTNKIPEYWYTFDGVAESAIEINAVVPQTMSDDADISSDIDNVFKGNKPQFSITNVNTTEPNGDFAASKLTYTYFFDAAKNNGRKVSVKQANGTNREYTLNVQNDGKILTATYGAVRQVVAYIDPTTGIATYNNERVETNDPRSAAYELPERPWIVAGLNVAPATNDDDFAKDLLNKAKRGSGDEFYGIVGVSLRNQCDMTITGNETFASKFLRPVNIAETTDKVFQDGVDGGSTLKMLDLVVLSDWRNYAFASNKKYYEYYGIEKIEVDIPNITTTLAGGTLGKDKLSAVTDKIEISQDLVVAPTAWNVNALNYGTVKYTNNGTTVQDFKLRLPIKVTYLWGTVNAFIDVNVKKTVE